MGKSESAGDENSGENRLGRGGSIDFNALRLEGGARLRRDLN